MNMLKNAKLFQKLILMLGAIGLFSFIDTASQRENNAPAFSDKVMCISDKDAASSFVDIEEEQDKEIYFASCGGIF